MAEPPLTLRAVHDSGPGNRPPTRYVVHATAGGRGYPRESAAGVAHATALYFRTQAAGGSAHYVHDAGGNEEHCVPEDVIAWHAPPNQHSIGDEICSEPSYTRDQWLSNAVWPAVRASALRCREVCDRYGLPKVKIGAADLLAGAHGVCGHVDVSNAWHQTTHWDPGANFPWDDYMAVVNGQDPEGDDLPTPDDVWNLSINGVKARDRLIGIDSIQLPQIHAAVDAVRADLDAVKAEMLTPDDVWNLIINGVKARDRLIGIDSIQLPQVHAELDAVKAELDAVRAELAAVRAALPR